MRYILLGSIICLSLTLSAQAQEYISLSPIFEVTAPESHIYAVKAGDSLGLDIFFPKSGSDTLRPLVLFVHGGGFRGGTRDGETQYSFCRELAARGYIAATLSYRLTMKGKSFHCDQPAENKVKTFQAAVNDVRDATRFVLDKANTWHIDPGKIILAGSSAGAEAVLHAAYWPVDSYNEESQSLPSSFSYAGVISFAGAIVDEEMIQAENAIPSQFFHGTCDPLVPYGTAPHHFCQPGDPGYLMLTGSYHLAERLRILGKSYYLHTTCGAGHEIAGNPMRQNVKEIADFLYHDVIKGRFRQVHIQINPNGLPCEPSRDIPCNE